MASDASTMGPRRSGRGGRRLDRTRDAAILDTTLEVLGELGYERMTMDAVAARAGAAKTTLYRRWESKPRLVLDALTHMERREAEVAQPPDTGSLRGDLIALIKPKSIREGQQKLQVIKGILSMAADDFTLSDVANAVFIEPWAAVVLTMMQRATARGEISPNADLVTLSRVIPSLAAYRGLIEGTAVNRPFLLSMIDNVLLPAASTARASR